MKKILGICVVLAALAAFVGCASAPKQPGINPPAPTVKSYPPQILEHKGTSFGVDYPADIKAAINGAKAVQKLSEYANKYVVVVDVTGDDLEGTQLTASRLNAQPQLAQAISTRVSDKFVGAQVGDKNKLEGYMERAVKSVSEATFSGFTMESDWWVKQQTFTSDGKPDKQVYRIIQVWAIDKDLLQTQIKKQISSAAGAEPKTEDKQKAIDLVNKSTFFDDF